MEKFISLIGIPMQIGICYALSTNRKKIDWKLVGWGISLQLIFAVLILKTTYGKQLFGVLNDAVVKMLSFTEAGASFVFGNLVKFVVPVGVSDPSQAPELAAQVTNMKLTAATGAF
ncbi:MAG: hypothetical protein EOM80_19405, partial [Erysipelotrichia bacterium]|nr:hypothetical protein [Erysipelotrichia bacterium]